jgi:hypothetical protein
MDKFSQLNEHVIRSKLEVKKEMKFKFKKVLITVL